MTNSQDLVAEEPRTPDDICYDNVDQDAPTNFSDQIATATQAAPVAAEGISLAPAPFADLVTGGPEGCTLSGPEIPVLRLGIDPAPLCLHQWKTPTLSEIAAIADLTARAWALFANGVRGIDPISIALLESVRDEGLIGLSVHHGGMGPAPEPPRPKVAKRRRSAFPPAGLPSLFEPVKSAEGVTPTKEANRG